MVESVRESSAPANDAQLLTTYFEQAATMLINRPA